jgi:hypothetical protein
MRRDPASPGAINLFLAGTAQPLSAGTANATGEYELSLRGNVAPLRSGAVLPAVGDLVTVFPRGGAHAFLLENCTQVRQ